MIEAKIPVDEVGRLAALARYDILDTLPEQEYDNLTKLAAQMTGKPISMITLIDKDRQWFKSRLGMPLTHTAREIAFCSHTITDPDNVFTVPDATEDERFKDNPLTLSEPAVVFYSGAPIVTPDGHALGTICVIDEKPGNLSVEQENSLKVLADQIMVMLELRRVIKMLIVQNDEISVLNDQLNQYAHSFAHEIKTPVRGIQSLVEWFREDHGKALNPEALDMLENMEGKLGYLDGLTDGMVDYHMITNGVMAVQPFTFDELIERLSERRPEWKTVKWVRKGNGY